MNASRVSGQVMGGHRSKGKVGNKIGANADMNTQQ
jgi:hypothetical protein